MLTHTPHSLRELDAPALRQLVEETVRDRWAKPVAGALGHVVPAAAPMRAYMASVGRLVKSLGYESFLVGTMRQSSFAWLFHFGFYQLAGWRVRRWERDPANREAVERMTEFAERNLDLPAGLSE